MFNYTWKLYRQNAQLASCTFAYVNTIFFHNLAYAVHHCGFLTRDGAKAVNQISHSIPC